MNRGPFSVLISTYYKDDSKQLKNSLDSIIHQSVLPGEIVLIKDGPLTNDLNKVIEDFDIQYSFFKIITLPVNKGLGNALAIGLEECSYELVARMDADDISKYDRFEKQLQIFQQFPDIDVVSAWIEEFEDNISNIISIKKLPEYHGDIYKYAKKRCPVNHPVVMFKKQSVINSGNYVNFPLFEDYFLWIRMLQKGAKFYNIQESLLYFRFSPAMFKRRGGIKYAFREIDFQKEIWQRSFTSFPVFLVISLFVFWLGLYLIILEH